MRLLKLLLVPALLAGLGCSVTGRVQVNPPTPHGQYLTGKGLPGLGPVCATLEFKHEF